MGNLFDKLNDQRDLDLEYPSETRVLSCDEEWYLENIPCDDYVLDADTTKVLKEAMHLLESIGIVISRREA
jgi:hypothetical protein